MNRDRFLECDVFFLGTARSIDSQRSAKIEGRPNPMRSNVGMTKDVEINDRRKLEGEFGL